MSIRLKNHVWNHAPVKGARLLVLLAIADHANEEGLCWPSVQRLADRARICERQARRHLRALEEEGHITTRLSFGRGRRALFHLNHLPPGRPHEGSENDTTASEPAPIAEPVSDSPHRADSPLHNQTERLSQGIKPAATATEKGTCDATQKGTSGATFLAEKGTSRTQKGDIAPHTRVEPLNEPPILKTTIKSEPGAQATESATHPLPPPFSICEDWISTATHVTKTPATKTPATKLPIHQSTKTPATKPPDTTHFRAALCHILGWDERILGQGPRNQLLETARALASAGYTEIDLRDFWTEWRRDWRWKKNRSHPTLNQLRCEVGRVKKEAHNGGALAATPTRDAPVANLDSAPILAIPTLSAEDIALKEKMKNARKHGRTNPPHTQD